MKKYIFAAAAAAVLLAGGCRTSELSFNRPAEKTRLADGSEVVAYLSGENTGYYLFNLIPLWCGNPYRPNTGDYSVFRSRLSEISNEYMLSDYAEKWLKADKVIDFSHSRRSTGISTLWLVWTDVITTRGTAIKAR